MKNFEDFISLINQPEKREQLSRVYTSDSDNQYRLDNTEDALALIGKLTKESADTTLWILSEYHKWLNG